MLKSDGTAWSALTFQDRVYDDYSGGFSFTSLPVAGGPTALPNAGCTYRFNPPVTNDLAVSTVCAVATLPADQSYAYRAYLTNPHTTIVAISTLAAGATATVRFLETAAGTGWHHHGHRKRAHRWQHH